MQEFEVIPLAEVNESQESVDTLHTEVNALEVKTQEDLEQVAENIATVKKAKNKVTEDRDKYINPAKTIIAQAKERYDPIIKQCDIIESELKSKAQVYLLEEETKAEKAQMASRSK